MFVAQSAGLLLVLWFYVCYRVRPELLYYLRPHVFLLDRSFFFETVSRPGGLVDYVSAFLCPWFAWDWLGAAIIVALVALICAATRSLISAVGQRGGEIAYWLPAVFLVLLLGQYCHPTPLCVGLGLMLLGVNLYVRLGALRVLIRVAVFLAALAAFFFLAAGMCVVFACLCACCEGFVQRRRVLAAGYLLCGLALPLAAGWWPFDLVYAEALRGLYLPEGQHWLAIPSSPPLAMAFYSLVILAVVSAVALGGWRRKSTPSEKADQEEADGSNDANAERNASARASWKIRVAVPVGALALLCLADVSAFDSTKQCLLEVESHSLQQQWDEVLAWSERIPSSDERSYDPRIVYCVNRALYFKGVLLERMFAYPQVFFMPSLTLIHADIDTTSRLTPRECSEIFFDLGRVNESEQMAYEALELCGRRPETLKRLAYIYVIKGEPEIARHFLRLLERSLLHRRWARSLLNQLDSDPTLSDDPVVASRRELVVKQDSIGDARDVELLLEGLLESNPRNRMALEYLMAHYLLTRQVDRIASDRSRFDALDYPEFPRHVEEALACYVATTGLKELDLGTRSFHAETWRRFSKFVELHQQAHGNSEAAFTTLFPEFHDTYFFAFAFSHNIASLKAVRAAE